MNYINDSITHELIINKSRFITNIYRVNTLDEIDSILNDIRKQHAFANHNCYAYIIGANQDIQKCSDDGEPSKTAGFPMLEVLKKQELTNILAITTRYFGGVMLGAGGLIRAYSQSVSDALKKATFYIQDTLNIYKLIIDYTYYNSIISSNLDISILDSTFLEKVTLTIGISKDNTPNILKSFEDITNATSTCTFLYEKIVEILPNKKTTD